MDVVNINPKKFQEAKVSAEKFYVSINEVYCPFLKEKVNFNAKGLEHLKFKGRERARSQGDQYVRLRLISLAPKIISQSHTVQGLQETRGFERERSNGKWAQVVRNITYFEFIAVIEKARVRIIVKQVEQGPKYFWSIIPFWRMNSLGARLLHNGKPEED